MTDFAEIWSYLSEGELLWLSATVVVFAMADWISAKSGRNPVVNPVLISVAILVPILQLTGTSYETYFDGAQFIHFLLGPATVALAIPLFANLGTIRRLLLPMMAALFAGSAVAVASAAGLSILAGLPDSFVMSILPKSATTPVSIGISEALGGSPTLTAALVIMTGLIGAITVTPMMNLLGIRNWPARGFAAGVAAHGLGTARAFQVKETAGAFAGIGMALNAIMTAILAPLAALLLQ